jgi:hypothetical protein
MVACGFRKLIPSRRRSSLSSQLNRLALMGLKFSIRTICVPSGMTISSSGWAKWRCTTSGATVRVAVVPLVELPTSRPLVELKALALTELKDNFSKVIKPQSLEKYSACDDRGCRNIAGPRNCQ